MNIIFLTAGNLNNASSRTRVFQLIPYLKPKNIKAKAIVRNPYIAVRPKDFPERVRQHAHIQWNMLRFLITAFFFKNIYIQKVYLPRFMAFLFVLARKNLVFDYVDAIFTNEALGSIKKKKLRRMNYMLRKANWIVVENETNSAYSRQFNSNVLIVTGPIECNRYKPVRNTEPKERVVIGWIGSSSTSMYLEVLREPITVLAKKYPWIELLIVGAKDIDFPGVSVFSHPWSLDTEMELLSAMDIGVMPLFDDLWCKGKGGYKLLQYMAIGIPSVASPVGVNKEITQQGITGYLAENQENWVQYLEELILDSEKRVQLGRAAREFVVQNYSYEVYMPKIMGCLVN